MTITCQKCNLGHNPYCNNMKGIGNSTNPTYMIVSDWVRHAWVANGRIFSGPVRQETLNTLKEAEIDIKDCYFTSLVKCPTIKGEKLFGKAKEGKPKKENIDCCKDILEQEINRMKPKVIIALGDLTFNFFFPKLKLAEKRCQVLYHGQYKCYVIGIYHLETMTLTAEFDRIIVKAFKQAKDAVCNPDKIFHPVQPKYVQILTVDGLKKVLERVKNVECFSYDVEASSLNQREAKLLSIGISWKVNTGVSFPIYVKDEDKCKTILDEANKKLTKDLSKEEKQKVRLEVKKVEKEIGQNPPLKSYWGDRHDEVMGIIKEIFAVPCKKGGHNIDYDNKVLYYNGIEVNNVTFDTMLMHHMLDEERPKDLDYLSWVDTDKGGYKMAKEVYLDTVNSNFAHIPLNVLLNYNAGDADTTLELYHKYKPMIISEGMAHEFSQVRMPLLLELIKVSITGMKVNANYLINVKKELKENIKKSEDNIKKFLIKYYPKVQIIQESNEKGKDPLTKYFNIKSSADLKELLYEKMKAPKTILTESGEPSTNEAALIKLSKKYDIIKDILDHRKNTKFLDTYTDGILKLCDANGRVHANFNLTGTSSQRLSCDSPNLQNIPRESTIKKIFIPEKGYGIMEVDFSQQELRCLAFLSGDPAMCDAYANEKDLHMELAKSIFNKKEEDVTKEERTIAKCCFDENSMILTPNGYVKAKDLGDSKVLTLDGKEQTQQHIFEKQQGYMITLSNGQKLRVTKNHKFKMFDTLKPYWKEASNLKVGDVLGSVKWSAFGDYKKFTVGQDLRTHTYAQTFTFEEKMAYTMGLYLSDGCVTGENNNRLDILIKPQNRHVVLQALKPFGVKERTYEGKDYTLASVYTRALNDWVKDNFGFKKCKRIPDFIYTCPYSVVKAFLSGLLDSDAYICNRIHFISTNEQLARDVAKLGTLLGNEIKFHWHKYSTKIDGKKYTGILYETTFITKPDVNLYAKKEKFDMDIIKDKSMRTGWKIDKNEFPDNYYNGKYNNDINNYRTGKMKLISVRTANVLGLEHKSYNPAEIIEIEPVEVNACIMETATHYFVGEGFESPNCNFLTSYGGGPGVLKDNLEKAGIIITEAKAEKMLKGWDKKFSFAVSYLNKQVDFFKNHGYLQTPAGLKKHYYKTYAYGALTSTQLKSARNYVIQGYCSSITCKVLLDIIRELRKRNLQSRVISTVHDSILIEYKLEELQEVLKICKEKTWRTFPAFNGHILKSDVEASESSWGEKKKINWDGSKPKED